MRLARLVSGAVLVLLLLGLGADAALADNCGSLLDCYQELGTAAKVLFWLGPFMAMWLLQQQMAARRESEAQQAYQSDQEALWKEAKEQGQEPPPGAEEVGKDIEELLKWMEGVNPGGGESNCGWVAAAVDDRLETGPHPVVSEEGVERPDHIAPVIGDDKEGTPIDLIEQWEGGDHEFEPTSPAQVEQWLRENPDGRGILYVEWEGGNSHVLNVVNHNGRMYYIDGQFQPPRVSSTLEGIYGPEQAGGAHDFRWLQTNP